MDSNQRLPPCQGDTLPTELRGQKRNGSISKKSLNSKQILIFRKIPPKFYTRFRRDVKRRRNSTRNFTIMPKLRVKFYRACTTLACFAPAYSAPLLFYLVALLHPASFHLLALLRPVLFCPPASPPCAR